MASYVLLLVILVTERTFYQLSCLDHGVTGFLALRCISIMHVKKLIFDATAFFTSFRNYLLACHNINNQLFENVKHSS